MRCRIPAAQAFAICFVALSAVARADSIIVKGKHYENVYVRMGTDVYYIQNPADGSMVEVPKDQVREKDIAITPDREARRQMQFEWQQKRKNKSASSSILPDAAASKPAPLPATVPAKAPTPESKHVPAAAKSKSKPSA